MSVKVAIVAALEREARFAVRGWNVCRREHDGRQYKFFENGGAVLVCGGIGAEAARRATEAIISLYHPRLMISAGFAGALDPALKVGDRFLPRYVVNAADGSRIDTGTGSGILVSYGSVAGTEQKEKLRRSYASQAIDMEAAAVAMGAQARGLPFVACKTISDDHDFEMPALERFVDQDGQFKTARFVLFAVGRPWLWPSLIKLARNSSRAAAELGRWLSQYNARAETLENKPAELHPIK